MLTRDITPKIDPSLWEMLYCWEKEREQVVSLAWESALWSGRPLWGPGRPEVTQGVEYKRNLQHIKRVVTEPAADAKCSTESEGDTPEPAPSLELTDQATQETTPIGVIVAGTPRRSGRVSQPPKALADYVLYWTFQNLLSWRNLFKVMNAVYVGFVEIGNLWACSHLDIRLSLCSHSLVYLSSFVDF